MALILKDACVETASAPGTGTFTLLGVPAGLGVRTFGTAGYTTGQKVPYVATDNTALREVGIGTYNSTGPTLTRDTVLSNTSGTTSKLDFTGLTYVFAGPPAAKLLLLDESDNLDIPGNVDIAGNLSVSGSFAFSGGTPGWVFLATYTASGAAYLSMELPNTYRRFRFYGDSVSVSVAGADIGLRFSSDGGGTYKTNNYHWSSMYRASGTSGGDSLSASGTSWIQIGPPGNTLGGGNADGDMIVNIFPGSASVAPRVLSEYYGFTNTPANIRHSAGGGYNTPSTFAVMDYCRIFPSSGNFSGRFIMEGMP